MPQCLPAWWSSQKVGLSFFFLVSLSCSSSPNSGSGWSLVVQLYVHYNMGLYYQSWVATYHIHLPPSFTPHFKLCIISFPMFDLSLILWYVTCTAGQSRRMGERFWETSWRGSGCSSPLVSETSPQKTHFFLKFLFNFPVSVFFAGRRKAANVTLLTSLVEGEHLIMHLAYEEICDGIICYLIVIHVIQSHYQGDKRQCCPECEQHHGL